ncbi:MAG: dioxygenase [Hyphomicrobiales bacterium]|nr:dioxygenase [Hyphomicrobiales bacterium]
MSGRLPTYFLSHGGGPWPYMKDELGGRFDKLEASLLDLRRELGEAPRAVLVVSGHWEAPEFTVSAAEKPPMVYDYHGFPEHTYHIKYGAPGSPALAARVQALLEAGGIRCLSDAARGFDHGTFSLMKPLYPDEDMPIVQLSLHAGYDPGLHIRAGRLLTPLRDEGVLILGSGFSYHNLRLWGASAAAPSRAFDAWLQQTLIASSPQERVNRLVGWSGAPSARTAHPREDHLLPLMTAVGAAEDEPAALVYHEDAFMGAIAASSFRFGEIAAGASRIAA